MRGIFNELQLRDLRKKTLEWIKDRLEKLQDVLENRTARSAKTLRDLLGPIRLELVTPDIGRPFYRVTRWR